MKPKTDQDTTWYIILYIIYTYVTQIMGMSWNLNPTKYDISLANGQWSRLSPLTLFVGLNQKRLSQRPLLVVSARLHPWPAKQRLLLLRRHLRLIVAVRGMNQEVSWETPKPRSHLEWLLDTQWSLLQIISNEPIMPNSNIFIYIYTLSFHIPRKEGFAKYLNFQSENPVFLWLHRRRLLTLGCWRVFTGYSHIFTAYSRVFDRLAKPVLPPKAGFRCQNRFFWVFAQKPGFCPATHSVSGYGSHIGIYIYIYI